MIRLSKLGDYAIVVLCELARADGPLSACALARKSAVPEPTVAKLMKALARGGIVTSQRGMTGGYTLARAAREISVADVIAAVEGPIALTDCVEGHTGNCEVEQTCSVRGNWNRINDAIRAALASVSLAEMAQPGMPAAFLATDIGLERVAG